MVKFSFLLNFLLLKYLQNDDEISAFVAYHSYSTPVTLNLLVLLYTNNMNNSTKGREVSTIYYTKTR